MFSTALCPKRPFMAGVLVLALYAPGAAQADPPTREQDRPLAYELEHLADEAISGGVPKDGIPAIDEPEFMSASEADRFLEPDDVVIGLVIEGEARAYPRRVLAWHEIVNDSLAGTALSVTYCPLTGTAIGFERGDTTFGVSGDLVNSNLIMYDRATDSRWPQMLGVAVSGPLQGEALREVPLDWTTWELWRAAHPQTSVLSRRTGYVRDYNDDPYGSYTPATDYYAEGRPIFPLLNRDDRLTPKTVVTGARSAHGAVAFLKSGLREVRIAYLEAEDGMRFTAVHDPQLDAVHVYHNPDNRDFRFEDGAYHAGEQSWEADSLPLEPVNNYDAMWFAWAAFYPDTMLFEG
jgi:hypothetical protein